LHSASTNLGGEGISPYDPTASPLNFSATGGFEVLPPVIHDIPGGVVIGRFTDGTIHLSVLNGSMSVDVTLFGPFDNNRSFSASATGPTVQTQTCRASPGATVGDVVITTKATLGLQHVGLAEIVVVRSARLHCAT
jgi:hypothetical protein